jgi:exoribonuclease R
VLRGLVSAGEVVQIPDGRYQLEEPAGVERGVVALHRGRLCVGEIPLETGRRVRLRPGDVVEMQIGQGADGDIARVLRVIEYSAEPIIGQLNGRGRHPYVDSLSPHYKGRVSLVDPPAFGNHGDTVSVRIVDEDRRGLVGYVEALVSDRRGAAHAAETMLASHGVPRQWPSAVLSAAQRLPKAVVPARHPDRRDLAGLPLVTIDGETARDFDDAVYAARRRGGWRLVVAIADVAHYVKPKGALDAEALERGNSVYLPDRVVPMLPEAISNGLCSLKPREPRLAMVCDMQVSNAGNVTRFEFYEAVIRSWQRLTYKRVQEFLDSGALDVEPEVCRSLADLQGAGFRHSRGDAGAFRRSRCGHSPLHPHGRPPAHRGSHDRRQRVRGDVCRKARSLRSVSGARRAVGRKGPAGTAGVRLRRDSPAAGAA